jgi:epoxyqueuosine reductase
MVSVRDRIVEICRDEGFDLAGVTSVAPPADGGRFSNWLDSGMHGDMAYLERFRDRILNPSLVHPGSRTIVSLGVVHARPEGGFAGGGRVARYALGRDYHAVIESMARRVVRRLQAEGIGASFRSVVDAGPVLERSIAARAGLGFPSKSANLLHYKFGPWFFLAEIFLDREIEETAEAVRAPGSCGTCTRCIDLCPTGAIVEPGRVDSRMCISYLTIEYKGIVSDALKQKMGGWVFGCDVCSEVCPFGDPAFDASARFGRHAALDLALVDLLLLPEDAFKRIFAGSPMRRAKRAGMARNAAIAIGNMKLSVAGSALKSVAREDPDAAVRDAARWALERI